jgi:vacuolar protein sorting-associated protein 18
MLIMILMLTDPDSSEHQSTARDFQAFLRDHIEDLRMHPTTTFQLLASHGRRQEMLLYATLIEDLDRVISYHIQDREYARALQVR